MFKEKSCLFPNKYQSLKKFWVIFWVKTLFWPKKHFSAECKNGRFSVILAWIGSVPSGYPNPTRYPVFFSIPNPTRFSFRNHRVAGYPKRRVLPNISGKPKVLGTSRYFGYHPHKRKTIPSSGALLREPQRRNQGCKKSAKSAILTSIMTVELLSNYLTI